MIRLASRIVTGFHVSGWVPALWCAVALAVLGNLVFFLYATRLRSMVRTAPFITLPRESLALGSWNRISQSARYLPSCYGFMLAVR
jgi:hypothetical protein